MTARTRHLYRFAYFSEQTLDASMTKHQYNETTSYLLIQLQIDGCMLVGRCTNSAVLLIMALPGQRICQAAGSRMDANRVSDP